LQIMVFVPQANNLLAHYFFQYINDIFIAIGTRKNDYAELHATKLIYAGAFKLK
jgi:hypothetical protein